MADFVADIGGTRTRMAFVVQGRLEGLTILDTNTCGDLEDVLADYTARSPAALDRAALAVAGPTNGTSAALTNIGQTLIADSLQRRLGTTSVRLLNDFEAVAQATATVQADGLSIIRGTADLKAGNRLVIGPGTGLGVGCLLKDGTVGFTCHPCEGGHVGIGPRSRFEVAVFEALTKLWPETVFGDSLCVEAETLLSGTGIPYLYRAVAAVEGRKPEQTDSPVIMASAKAGSDPVAVATAKIFKRHLAALAGDLAILFNATGGIFFCGGVAQRNGWLFENDFLAHLDAGGRFQAQRAQYDVYVHRSGLIGLSGAASVLGHRVLVPDT